MNAALYAGMVPMSHAATGDSGICSFAMGAPFLGSWLVELPSCHGLGRPPFSSPRDATAQRSLRQQARVSSLKACHQVVASLQRSRGLFLREVAGVHDQQSLFFAFGSLSERFRMIRRGSYAR